MFTYVLLRVLHIASAAAWFGLPLGLPGAVRRGLDRSPEAFSEAAHAVVRQTRLSIIFGLVLLASGVANIFDVGGFAVVHRNIHTGLGLVVIMLALQVFALRPLGAKLVGLAGGATAPGDEGRKLRKRLAMLSGVFQLLWLAVLVLMYWR